MNFSTDCQSCSPYCLNRSQALSLLLSLPGPSPSLGILTDLTHRLEHHDLQKQLDEFSDALREYTHGGQVSSVSSKAGTGEGSGRRWWDGVWDEHASEKTGRLVIRKEGLVNGAENGSHAGDTASTTMAIPDLRVAWDGMVVHFQRSSSPPSSS